MLTAADGERRQASSTKLDYKISDGATRLTEQKEANRKLAAKLQAESKADVELTAAHSAALQELESRIASQLEASEAEAQSQQAVIDALQTDSANADSSLAAKLKQAEQALSTQQAWSDGLER